MSCCAPPLLPAAKMLTLSHVSLLVAKTSDSNNNSPGCGALALKMMSSRSSLLAARARCAGVAQAPAGPKRCLFGAPSPTDTQRLLREDQEAVKARMERRWGWDLTKEGPTSSSTWQWEPVKAARRHPYAARVSAPRAVTPVTPVTPVPALLSPLPATPSTPNTSTTSSSSGTSTLPESPVSPASFCLSSPSTMRPTPSWAEDSEDSCCGGSDSDSSTTCGTSPRPVPVQTRITDFWRTRRCSTSEGVVKANPGVPASTPSARTCPV